MMEVPKLEEKGKKSEKEEKIVNLEELKKLIESFRNLEHLHAFFKDLS